MKLKIMIITGTLFLGISVNAWSEMIVHYDNPKKNYSSISFDSSIPQPPVYSNPLVFASDIDNSGVIGVNHIDGYQTNGWSQASDLDLTKYISFSVTPTSGYKLEFDSFQIDLWQSGPRKFALRWDLDGFTTNLFTGTNLIASSNPTKASYTFSLDSLSARTTASDFRLYFYDAAPDNLNNLISDRSLIAMGGMGDGIVLNGAISPVGSISPVPEPSTFLLIGAGLAIACIWKKTKLGV